MAASTRFGLPYKGSKNAIARALIQRLPPARHFYDPFCGGGAMAHAAALSGKYQHIHLGDIIPTQAELVAKALKGDINADRLTRWIPREEFHAIKTTDRLAAICWSFSNNTEEYIYGREITPYKHALHHLILLADPAPMRALGIEPPETACNPMDTTERRQAAVRRWAKQYEDEIGGKYTEYYERLTARRRAEFEEKYNDILGGKSAKDLIADEEGKLRALLCAALKQSGRTQVEIGRHIGTQMHGHYFGASQWQFPSECQYHKMREIMPTLPEDYQATTRRLDFLKDLGALESIGNLCALESMRNVQRVMRMRLPPHRARAVTITHACQSYDQTDIQTDGGAVIYCDPPYRGTSGYDGEEVTMFDHERFYNWCERQPCPVYISEYSMP